MNLAHARICAIGERAMATVKQWRLLRKLRCSTTRITDIVRAVLALQLATQGGDQHQQRREGPKHRVAPESHPRQDR